MSEPSRSTPPKSSASAQRAAGWVGFFALTLFVLIWAGSATWGGSTWWFHDLRTHFYPWRAWAAETNAAGELPLWAPIGHGYPLFADGQAGVLYPPTVILGRLFSPVMAFNLSILLHQLLAGGGAMYLARTMQRTVPAAFVAGIAYAFSGYLASHLVYLGMYQVIALAPWLVALAVRAARDGGPWPWRAGLIAGLIWYAGHPQVALYASYAALIAALFENREYKVILPRLFIAFGIGACLAAPQFVATYELIQFGERDGGVDAAFAATGSLPLEEIGNSVFPMLFGIDSPADVQLSYAHRAGDYFGRGVSFWEDCFYLGAVTVAFAGVGTRLRPGRRWALLISLGLVLMLGSGTPLYPLLRLFPGMGYFRFPVRGALLVVLGATQLAALGLDRLLIALYVDKRIAERTAWAFGGTAAGIIALSSSLFAALAFSRDSAIAHLAPRLIHATDTEVRTPELALERATQVVDGLLRQGAPWSWGVFWPAALFGALAISFGMAARGRVAISVPVRVAMMGLCCDLFLFSDGFNPRTPTDEVVKRPESAVVWLGVPGPWRQTVLGRRGSAEYDRELSSSNLGLLWDAEDVIVPSPLRMLRNEAWLSAVGLDLGLTDGDAQETKFREHRQLADLSGVRWLTTTRILDLPGLTEVHAQPVGTEGGVVRVYENAQAFPRAFAVGCTVPAGVSPLADVIGLADPHATAVVEGDGVATCVPKPAGSVAVERLGASAYRLTMELDVDGLVVLTESFYPGWVARLDGVEMPIVRADDLFMGVPVTSGHHTLEMAYLPTRLYSAFGIACVIFGLTMARARWISVREGAA